MGIFTDLAGEDIEALEREINEKDMEIARLEDFLREAVKEARRGYIRLEDVLKIIIKYQPNNSGLRGQIVTAGDIYEEIFRDIKKEIKSLGEKSTQIIYRDGTVEND